MIKILIVSDNEEYISTLKNDIVNHKQLKLIAIARDEVEALDLIMNEKPDVVIVNIKIPSLNWIEIIENRPIFILVSHKDGSERKALVLDKGEYEIKSFSSNALLSIVSLKSKKIYKEENITSMLNNVGINSTMKGQQYLVDLLLMVLNDGAFKLFDEILYPTIAEKYDVTTSSVERCVRYAIEFMWKHVPPESLEDYFGVNIVKKFTVKEFVEVACNKLKKSTSGKDIRVKNKTPLRYTLSNDGSLCIPSNTRTMSDISQGDLLDCGDGRRKDLEKSNYTKDIERILDSLNMPNDFNGYLYIVDAVLIALNMIQVNTMLHKIIYLVIANKYNVTQSSIERAIRYAITFIWEQSGAYFINTQLNINLDQKPTNGEFISILVDVIKANLGQPLTDSYFNSEADNSHRIRLGRWHGFTIPKKIRYELNINPKDLLEFIDDGEKIIIKKLQSPIDNI